MGAAPQQRGLGRQGMEKGLWAERKDKTQEKDRQDKTREGRAQWVVSFAYPEEGEQIAALERWLG
jgi:hypothetical protein